MLLDENLEFEDVLKSQFEGLLKEVSKNEGLPYRN